MKKLFSVLLAVCMVCGILAGCSGAAETDDTDYSAMTIEELKPLLSTVSDGTLTVATSPDYAPFEFYAIGEDGTPTLAGFDMALAQYVADYLGLKLEIVPMDFDGTLSELKNKKCDLSMAGYSPDPAREGAMDFSIVYYTGNQAFVCTEENADQFKTLEDANNSAYQIGAQLGSIQHKLAMENTPDADIIPLGKVTDIVAELVSGKMDCDFIETIVAEAYQKNFPQLHIAMEVPYDTDGYVVGVSKGNGPLLAAVNLALQAAMDDGSLAGYIEDANALSTGNIHEGLLDQNGGLPAAE